MFENVGVLRHSNFTVRFVWLAGMLDCDHACFKHRYFTLTYMGLETGHMIVTEHLIACTPHYVVMVTLLTLFSSK